MKQKTFEQIFERCQFFFRSKIDPFANQTKQKIQHTSLIRREDDVIIDNFTNSQFIWASTNELLCANAPQNLLLYFIRVLLFVLSLVYFPLFCLSNQKFISIFLGVASSFWLSIFWMRSIRPKLVCRISVCLEIMASLLWFAWENLFVVQRMCINQLEIDSVFRYCIGIILEKCEKNIQWEPISTHHCG